MELRINLERYKKSGLTMDCFIVLNVIEYLEKYNIIPYRQAIHNITGYDKRSITRYFKILKEKGYIKQEDAFKPVHLDYDKKENINELFKKVWEDLEKKTQRRKNNEKI